MAPQEQDVPNRVTRQKTRDVALVSSPDPQQVINLGLPNATPTHDVLVSGSDPSLQQDLVDITFRYLHIAMLNMYMPLS